MQANAAQSVWPELEANSEAIRQGTSFLGLLTDQQYGAPVSQLGGQRIGPQFRHVLEHYQSFFDGLKAENAVRLCEVDYENRKRDLRLEVNRSFAIEAAHAISRTMRSLHELKPRTSLLVKREEGLAPDCWTDSSVAREMQFLLSHTIHHYALIGMISRCLGVQPPDDFGVAPSTLRHQRKLMECAP